MSMCMGVNDKNHGVHYFPDYRWDLLPLTLLDPLLFRQGKIVPTGVPSAISLSNQTLLAVLASDGKLLTSQKHSFPLLAGSEEEGIRIQEEDSEEAGGGEGMQEERKGEEQEAKRLEGGQGWWLGKNPLEEVWQSFGELVGGVQKKPDLQGLVKPVVSAKTFTVLFSTHPKLFLKPLFNSFLLFFFFFSFDAPLKGQRGRIGARAAASFCAEVWTGKGPGSFPLPS
jgi:hypothetical protein